MIGHSAEHSETATSLQLHI